MEKVSQIKMEGKGLAGAVKEAARAQGGWEKFIQKGDRVLVKPNCNTADEYPGSTDIAFLQEVIKQVLEIEPRKVLVGESSTMMANTENILQEKGVYDLEKIDERVEVVNFDKGNWVKQPLPQGQYLGKVSVPEVLGQMDKIIFLPCLKTHFLAQYTGALKLAVGLMRPRERLSLHAGHLQEKVAEVNLAVKPDLCIMDARTCFISKGPTKGHREHPGLILASACRTALDIEGIKIIQRYPSNSLADIRPREFPQIKRASELGIE